MQPTFFHIFIILFVNGNETENNLGLRRMPVLDPIERVKELTNYTRQWVRDNMVNVIV